MTWVMQTFMTSGWETVGETDGFPTTYATREEAEADLKDHIDRCRDAVRHGDMEDFDPADWRIHNITEDA